MMEAKDPKLNEVLTMQEVLGLMGDDPGANHNARIYDSRKFRTPGGLWKVWTRVVGTIRLFDKAEIERVLELPEPVPIDRPDIPLSKLIERRETAGLVGVSYEWLYRLSGLRTGLPVEAAPLHPVQLGSVNLWLKEEVKNYARRKKRANTTAIKKRPVGRKSTVAESATVDGFHQHPPAEPDGRSPAERESEAVGVV